MKVARIACFVGFKLGIPVILIGFWSAAIGAIGIVVAVPKAAVHEYYFFPRRKNQIWFAGKITPVQAITEARSMHHTADGKLW